MLKKPSSLGNGKAFDQAYGTRPPFFPIFRHRIEDLVTKGIKERFSLTQIIWTTAIVGTVILAQIVLDTTFRFSETPFLLSWVAIILVSLLFGTKSGILASFLSTIGVNIFFIRRDYLQVFQNITPWDWRLILFFAEGVIFSFYIGRSRRSRQIAIEQTETLLTLDYHLRKIINNIFGFVAILDTQGLIRDINSEPIRWSGIKPKRVIRKSLQDSYWFSYSPESKNTTKQLIDSALSGKATRNDMVVRIKNHKFRVLDLSVFPVANSQGIPQYLVAYGVDVSDRTKALNENKQLLRAYRKQKSRLENIVDTIMGVIWEIHTTDGWKTAQVTFINNYAEEFYRYPATQITTDFFLNNVVDPADKELFLSQTQTVIKQKTSVVCRYRTMRGDNKKIWTETRIRPIINEEGNVIGMSGMTMDITDMVKLEQQKDEFIRIASHELKTPITTVKAFAQILEKRLLATNDTEAINYIQRMNVYISKMTEIIIDFLDLSKIQSGQMELNKQRFDLRDLVREVADDIQATAESHKINVWGPDSCIVYSDISRISQVVINLLTNAIKYSPDTVDIDVLVEKSQNEVTVKVIDHGIGISKKNIKKIFNRFYRAKSAKSARIEGFGMGLYISSEIIKRHGGIMGVKSKLHHGSTFYFSLPLAES